MFGSQAGGREKDNSCSGKVKFHLSTCSTVAHPYRGVITHRKADISPIEVRRGDVPGTSECIQQRAEKAKNVVGWFAGAKD